MTKSYQALYQTGYTTGNQALNTLDGFYRNATASVFTAFLQYKF